MKEIVVQIDPKNESVLSQVRSCKSFFAARDENSIWLKGVPSSKKEALKIQQLPVLHRYYMDDTEQLFPYDGLTPIGQLKKLDWQTISDFIRIKLPVSALPGALPDSFDIRLQAAKKIQESTALLTSLFKWKSFVKTTSSVRFENIRFAVSKNAEVLLLGTPIISLPGKEYWSRGTILLPNGLDFEIPVLAKTIEQELNPKKDSLILFHEDGSWEKIELSHFKPVTRSGVLLTEID